MSVFLDHNATTPVRPAALEALTQAARIGGNASSVHAAGRAARARLEAARASLADAAGAPPGSVVFTSGATEALHLAMRSAVAAGVSRLIVSAIEHDAVGAVARALSALGVELQTLPVDQDGRADINALDRMLGEDARDTLVVLMAANNETGVIQPTFEAASLTQSRGARLLVDAVQVLAKTAFSALECGADYIALSGHKIGAPAGVGALLALGDAPVRADFVGGGQEHGRRAGTENIAGAAAFAAAAEAGVDALHDFAALGELRDEIERRVRALRPDAMILGENAPRLPNTTCIALPGFAAETQVMALDLAGVAVSAGSACSSGKVRPSHVLTAMGCPRRIAGAAIRVSLGWTTQSDDVDHFVDAWRAAVERAAPRQAQLHKEVS